VLLVVSVFLVFQRRPQAGAPPVDRV